LMQVIQITSLARSEAKRTPPEVKRKVR
jgi:hypothetical protein